jgi:hypothetical protein
VPIRAPHFALHFPVRHWREVTRDWADIAVSAEPKFRRVRFRFPVGIWALFWRTSGHCRGNHRLGASAAVELRTEARDCRGQPGAGCGCRRGARRAEIGAIRGPRAARNFSVRNGLLFTPLLRVKAGHVELPSLDAELGAKDQLLVHHLRAVLGCHPVVGAIIGDVEDLFAKRVIAPNVPRAIEIVPKAGFGMIFRKGVGGSEEPSIDPSRPVCDPRLRAESSQSRRPIDVASRTCPTQVHQALVRDDRPSLAAASAAHGVRGSWR